MTKTQTTCINCGSPLTGDFCSNCGEKKFSDHDKSISHFIHEAFHFITHLDGKFLKSLKLIFFKPGFLSQEYCRGIRKKYFRPVSLFLIGVILYLISPLITGLNMSHVTTVNTFSSMGITIVKDMSVRKAAEENITMDELATRYNAKSAKFAKFMLLILLPLTGCLLWLLFFRKRKYLFDHLMLGTELNTLLLYSIFLILPVLLTLTGKLLFLIANYEFDYDDYILAPVQIVVVSAGWGVAFRRFYNTGRWETIWKTFVFFILHSLLVYVVYRLILYMVVMQFV